MKDIKMTTEQDKLKYNAFTLNQQMKQRVGVAISELEKVYAHLGYKVEAPYDDIEALQHIYGLHYELEDKEQKETA